MIRNAILAVAGIALVASGAFAAQPVSQQDSAGGDATDTVNHAVNVNVVAGGGSTTITGPLGSNTIAQSLAVTASDGSIVTLGHISDTISTPSLMGYNLGSKTDLDSILASLDACSDLPEWLHKHRWLGQSDSGNDSELHDYSGVQFHAP